MADARVNGAQAAWLAALWGARRWLGLCLLGMSACAAPQAAPASPAPSLPEEQAPASGFAPGARVVEAKGQGLEFPLPDASGWRWDKREKHSWVARHQGSSSELLVRAWHFDGIARPEDCEREARSFRRELPVFAPAEIISESERLLAGTYRGRVTVGVRAAPASAPERVLGNVLGFGSDARACLMLAFSTSAAGPGARQIIAERLATIAGTVFERARRLEIEGRVSEPHP
jgi:hypothetical protein